MLDFRRYRWYRCQYDYSEHRPLQSLSSSSRTCPSFVSSSRRRCPKKKLRANPCTAKEYYKNKILRDPTPSPDPSLSDLQRHPRVRTPNPAAPPLLHLARPSRPINDSFSRLSRTLQLELPLQSLMLSISLLLRPHDDDDAIRRTCLWFSSVSQHGHESRNAP